MEGWEMNATAGPDAEGGTAGPPATGPMALALTHQRNRLAGMWAAELLGLFGLAAQDYIRDVMHPDHPQDAVHGDDQAAVVGKLKEDLAGRVTLGEIRAKMVHFLQEARHQIGRRE
jgi:hypothetical protein